MPETSYVRLWLWNGGCGDEPPSGGCVCLSSYLHANSMTWASTSKGVDPGRHRGRQGLCNTMVVCFTFRFVLRAPHSLQIALSLGGLASAPRQGPSSPSTHWQHASSPTIETSVVFRKD
uniref:Secreted protein n=1 Tax=Echinococcus granulosus TaxID=6210 RepID=A0A068WXH2_ECHGR|nr:hypothetical protein EgrG_002030100 [Echinococcus granulosus]